MMNTIMRILQSKRNNPFGQYAVIDYFLRVEFQHRGSPHVHILLWLANDPREKLSENKPKTIDLIDKLCSVDIKNSIENQYYAPLQVHKHTFTCYKQCGGRKKNTEECRFKIPFWPSRETSCFFWETGM